MKFEKRKLIIDRILFLESSFPVDRWQIGGIQFWPIVKNHIFSFEFKSTSQKKARQKVSAWRRWSRFLKWNIRAYLYNAKVSLKPSKFIFSGAHTHEVKWKARLINRYFSPMMEYLTSKHQSSTFIRYNRLEESSPMENAIEGKWLVDFYNPKVSFKKDWHALMKDDDFYKFTEQLKDFFPSYSKVFREKLIKALHSILAWKNFYSYVLKQTNASTAFGLCYYSNEMFGMNLAAKEMGVKSIDMQHGTISKLHPAYTFSKIPAGSYNVLPDEFWVWDENTSSLLKEQFASVPEIQVKLSGNPWLVETNQMLRYPQLEKISNPLIVYTHQPLRPPLDEYLLDVILKTQSQYSWWIRLHPKTTENEKCEIQKILTQHQLCDVVELNAATDLPLPALLSKASVHISKFSGSVIESTLMGVPTLILEEVGVQSFEELIADGKAVGIVQPDADQIIQQLSLMIRSGRETSALIHFSNCLEL
ncbi:MAG: hypothetical protein HYZ44_00245 [Bacteroidetes bacterium]|nr:hypothetical protein [Bacteroidota bacterium]